jgi:DNA-binding transcriptional LysR family regulator
MREKINLDLDLLRTFISVADGGSFASAALKVHRTQSAVSQQMHRLEQLISRELFANQGRNKILTNHGIKMLSYARKILELNDDACLAFLHDDVEAVLKIGSPDDTANTVLPYLLARFSKMYPNLSIEIIVKRSPYLMDMLQNNELDMAISTLNIVDYPSGIVLRTSPSLWYCSASYVLDMNKPLPLVVLNDPSIYKNMAINHLNQAGIPWRIAYTSTTLSGARAAVKAGLGVIARSIELHGDDLRIIGEQEGLPKLPDIQYSLFMKKYQANGIAQILFESLRNERISL